MTEMLEAWDDLIATALLGSERRPVALPARAGRRAARALAGRSKSRMGLPFGSGRGGSLADGEPTDAAGAPSAVARRRPRAGTGVGGDDLGDRDRRGPVRLSGRVRPRPEYG